MLEYLRTLSLYGQHLGKQGNREHTLTRLQVYDYKYAKDILNASSVELLTLVPFAQIVNEKNFLFLLEGISGPEYTTSEQWVGRAWEIIQGFPDHERKEAGGLIRPLQCAKNRGVRWEDLKDFVVTKQAAKTVVAQRREKI